MVLVQDMQGDRLYLRRAWNAEQSIRRHILNRINLPITEPADLKTQLDALFGTDTTMQRVACEVAAKNRITLITGGPGTGKTTTITHLVAEILKTEKQVLICAPSNNAVDLLALKLHQKGIKF